MSRMADDRDAETESASEQLLLITVLLIDRDEAPARLDTIKTFEFALDELDPDGHAALSGLPPLHLSATLGHLGIYVLVSLAGPDYPQTCEEFWASLN